MSAKIRTVNAELNRGVYMVKKAKKSVKKVNSIVKNVDVKKIAIVVVALGIVYAVATGIVA